MSSAEDLKGYIYDWALADVEREVLENFALLCRVPYRGVLRILDYCSLLSPASQAAVLTLRVQSSFWDVATARGVTWTPQDRQKLTEFGRALTTEGATERSLQGEHQTLSSSLLARLVKEILSDITGGSPLLEPGSRRVWRHKQELGEVQLVTWIDMGGRDRIIEYSHQVFLAGQTKPVLMTTHAPDWLGVSSQAQWNYQRGRTEAEIAGDIGVLVSHFIKGLAGFRP